MSRFYPCGGGADLPFDFYIVSAIVKGGSIIVSWATGKPATEQIDYGIDDKSVPNQTDIPIGDEGQRIYSLFHTVTFPQTYVGTRHYFRVRSQNRAGKELVSSIYSVYITDKTMLRVEEVEIKPISGGIAQIADDAVIEGSTLAISINNDVPHLDIEELEAAPVANASFTPASYGFNGNIQTQFDMEIATTIN